MAHEEKKCLRDLIMQDRPNASYSHTERKAILDYCQTDVDALVSLYGPLTARILRLPGDLDRALIRGRYMDAVAEMEYRGIPIDVEKLGNLLESWDNIKLQLIERINPEYRVFDGLTFKQNWFVEWLHREGIPWPETPTGKPKLDGDTFRQMAKAYPQVAPLHELRHSLGQLRLNDLAVGSDGRNRCLLSPFGANTSRHTPSNSRFIFGPSRWIRGLIKPEPGRALAYIDFSSQEIAIAAKLSNDLKMQRAYSTGDPYVSFAIQAGLAPEGATKETHKAIRNRCKSAVLGLGYGMREHSLSQRIGGPVIAARHLIEAHEETYRIFWRWVQGIIDEAMLHNRLYTTFGWQIAMGGEVNPRSVQNFPMQANGAEMLRLAVIMAMEAGIEICAPIHDAILIESSVETIDRDIRRMQEIMKQAGKIVLDGFEIRTDVDKVVYPNRYMDEAGAKMWNMVMDELGESQIEAPRLDATKTSKGGRFVG
jgi:DNA polymerase-1